MNDRHYGGLLAMSALHFTAMYALMFSMVNVYSNIFHNWNQFYMAAIMTAPMIILELIFMRRMYQNRTTNLILFAASIILLAIFFAFIRRQTAIADTQFLRSMIPHHAGAILMCEQATLRDTEIKDLCGRIIESQEEEITEMKAILSRLRP